MAINNLPSGEVLKIAFTRGDHATQPGGVILRKLRGEYVAHHFNRDKGSFLPREFFWGGYYSTEADGNAAFAAKLGGVMPMVCTKADILNEER